MSRFFTPALAIVLVTVCGCDSKLFPSKTEPIWHPFAGSLETTVSTHPNRGIIIVFGSETNPVSIQNRDEISKIAGGLPNNILVFADVSDLNSGAAKALKEQGLKVPTNLLYRWHSESWDLLPDEIDSSNLDNIWVQACANERISHSTEEDP